ncbi:DNA repair exonuclease [Candidatus Woesearchaeota archaeon]|nr:DNA repair exonuclease [Candidatus Woesearchaeota archaeon]
MKFAHLADCHIGSWRDPKLRHISTEAFARAIDICIEKEVDFILIAGDLFQTSLPAIEQLKGAVEKLKELKDQGIPVYIIAGSHDFSPSGKTMLDVLESAGLFINVAQGSVEDKQLRLNFTIDPKTGAKITGLLGKRAGLDRLYYEQLARENLEEEDGYKIFMFHAALEEFKPKDLEKAVVHPLSLLPRRFNYYAGGHVHYVKQFDKKEEGFGMIAYPGPLFPNSFKELEDLQRGGFYIVEDDRIEWHPIQIYNVHSISLECNHKTAEEVREMLLDEIKDKEFNDTIVTIRLSGTLEAGKPSDINFKDIFTMLYDKSAYFVMKNTAALTTKEFEEIKIEAKNTEEIEDALIREHLGQIKMDNLSVEKEKELVKALVRALSIEKEEGERQADFEERIRKEVKGNEFLE